MVSWRTPNYGYSKLHCTCFSHPAILADALSKSYNIRVRPMVYPVRPLSFLGPYNWAVGSLLGCKNHFTTDVTKAFRVINTVPWHSDLNAENAKIG
ncbi:hypothetical protein TNCT_205581 [Trichonephila clavata]|uniref:Uncharacterized protein n=1 Tax=Trichonephila clavata TaxID=2740835 RepID=A0A8X6FJW7_TRICU|nr:hypothetical protein TNCT_205581 [Trichonephila clavata]